MSHVHVSQESSYQLALLEADWVGELGMTLSVDVVAPRSANAGALTEVDTKGNVTVHQPRYSLVTFFEDTKQGIADAWTLTEVETKVDALVHVPRYSLLTLFADTDGFAWGNKKPGDWIKDVDSILNGIEAR